MKDTTVTRLNRLTERARRRAALTSFFMGHMSPTDRLLSRLYFEATASHWARIGDDAEHVASFQAGLEAVDISVSSSVDLGTGAGRTAVMTARKWDNAEVVGVDVSWRMIREARRMTSCDTVTFRRGDGTSLPIKAGSTDLVTCLNYLPSPFEVRRILRAGGELLVASSFENLKSGELSEHWAGLGMELVTRRNVGRGCFELFRLVDVVSAHLPAPREAVLDKANDAA